MGFAYVESIINEMTKCLSVNFEVFFVYFITVGLLQDWSDTLS